MSEKIKVGIVGLGRIARDQHIPGLLAKKNRFEIVAVCDNAPDRIGENIPESVKDVKKYADYAEMLKDSEIEMIVIGTRHPDHVPMAKAAMKAGKYAVVEKPCAISYEEGKELIEFARQYPGKLFLRHNRRFEGAFMKIRKLLKSGVLGKINMIKLYRSVGYQRRNDWMTMSEYAGGLLTNWGPHIVDHALRLLDSPVKDIWADIKSVISIGDGDDQIKILLRAENGCVADVEIAGSVTMMGREYEIWGDRGTLACPVDGKIVMRYVDPDIEFKPLKPHPENPPFKYGNFEENLRFIEQKIDIPPTDFNDIWDAIYDNIKQGVPYPITHEEGLEVIRICDLAVKQSGFVPGKK